MSGGQLEEERFDAVIARIRADFPRLRVEVQKDHKEVEAIATLPVQPGLTFALGVNLQNGDELHLTAGNFWAEWFPCGDQRVFDDSARRSSVFCRGITASLSPMYSTDP